LNQSPFLQIPQSDWIHSNDLAFAVWDGYPVAPGHSLIIPKRLTPSWWETTPDEQRAIFELLDEVKGIILSAGWKPDGWNIGMNLGAAAGQTVFHLHVHLIPRYKGDTVDPRGGVRHVIPERGNWKTSPCFSDAQKW
jgi:diadenosine tetraphosphate (Ap4A) HIT family hydrolase